MSGASLILQRKTKWQKISICVKICFLYQTHRNVFGTNIIYEGGGTLGRLSSILSIWRLRDELVLGYQGC